MAKLYTSPGRDFSPKAIRQLLDHHEKPGNKVIFLEEMHWKTRYGDTGDQVGAIFWQETPPKPEFTNWFVYYWRKDRMAILEGREPAAPQLMITGMDDFNPVIGAVYIPKIDTLAYSRYQHDFFYVPGSNVAVDGGLSYLRILGNSADYATVEYNLMTKSFKFEGRTHHVVRS